MLHAVRNMPSDALSWQSRSESNLGGTISPGSRDMATCLAGTRGAKPAAEGLQNEVHRQKFANRWQKEFGSLSNLFPIHEDFITCKGRLGDSHESLKYKMPIRVKNHIDFPDGPLSSHSFSMYLCCRLHSAGSSLLSALAQLARPLPPAPS